MDISLGRVLEAARERRATLTSEVAGYVILLAAQQLGGERSRVSVESVALDESGDVLVRRDGIASELDIETSLRRLLGTLIGLCASPPPAIVAVAERAPTGELRELVVELSAALIPINHAAAHRALARLYREARRAEGHVTDVSLPPIAERAVLPAPAVEPSQVEAIAFDALGAAPGQPEPVTSAVEALQPGELEIDVEIEAESQPSLAPADEVPPLAMEPPPEEVLAAPEAIEPEPEPALELPPIGGASHAAPRILEASETLLYAAPPRAPTPRWTESRSDVDDLLDAYLAESRSIEHVLRVLRDMVGLDVHPSP